MTIERTNVKYSFHITPILALSHSSIVQTMPGMWYRMVVTTLQVSVSPNGYQERRNRACLNNINRLTV